MFHPDQIEEVPRMFPLSPCVLPALQYHLSEIDEALKHNDSMIDLHKLYQIPTNCLCKSLLDWLFSARAFPFPVKFLFLHG